MNGIHTFLTLVLLTTTNFPNPNNCQSQSETKKVDIGDNKLDVLINDRLNYLEVFSGPETLPQLLSRPQVAEVRNFKFANEKIRPRDAKCLAPQSQIEAMEFSSDEIDSDDIQVLSLFSNLRDLKLVGDARPSAEVVRELGDLHLHLLFIGSKISKEQAQKLLALTELRKLILRSINNESEDLAHIAAPPALEALHIVGNAFDLHVPAAFSKCGFLKKVTFAGHWKETPWAALSSIKSIQELSFLDSNLTGEKLIHLADLPELVDLRITSDRFSLASLAQLEKCPKLRHVSVLCADPIADVAYAHLLKIKSLRSATVLFGDHSDEVFDGFEKEMERRIDEDRKKGILPPNDDE